MAESLGYEVRIGSPPPSPDGGPLAQLRDFALPEPKDLPQAVKDLLGRCMDGTEPTGRELKHNEVKKFAPQHINIIMLRAAGFRSGEIARWLELDPVYVSVVLNHPYGKKLISALVQHTAAGVTDIKTRLSIYASDMLDKIYGLALQESDLEKVSKVGFALLDRAGHGPTQKIQAETKRGMDTATEATLGRLSAALEESNAVDRVIMPGYVPKPPPEAQYLLGSPESQAESGGQEEVADPSLGSQAPRFLRRVAGDD